MVFYDNEYDRKLANNLLDLTKAKELSSYVGSGKYRNPYTIEPSYYNNHVSDNKYIQPGSSPSYPFFNSSELQDINKIGIYTNNIHPMQGNGFFEDVGNFFKPIASGILDIAAPAAGMFMGGPMGATVAKGAREGLRAVSGFGIKKNLKKKLGSVKGVGVYTGGKLSIAVKALREEAKKKKKADRDAKKLKVSEAKAAKAAKIAERKAARDEKKTAKAVAIAEKKLKVSEAKAAKAAKVDKVDKVDKVAKVAKVAKAAKAAKVAKADKSDKSDTISGGKRGVPADGRTARAVIVKKIMNEKGLKMIDASKYVKQHNLYK